jgi:hypothetical protein
MMDITMQESRLRVFAAELAKDLKTPADLSALTSQLAKPTIVAAFDEMYGVEVSAGLVSQVTNVCSGQVKLDTGLGFYAA